MSEPIDEHDQRLVANVHPSDWINPEPATCYNLVVIGAGTAGLVAAAGAAGLGAKVALVERELMGGDCLNVGCVPSKAILRSARALADVHDAKRFGIEVPANIRADFQAVMQRMRALRALISPHDSADRFRKLGVDVYLGSARFSSEDTVEVAGRILRFRKAIIATGGRALRPAIPGLADTGYLTNETIFKLTELPRRLAVLGAGPIGCELAQAFARFGSEVYLLANHNRILCRDDADAATLVQNELIRDGIHLLLDSQIRSVERQGMARVLRVTQGGSPQEIHADAILVAVGRSPNVEGLNLEAAGVGYDVKRGVHVSDRLQTRNRRIYAAGDICSRYKFTHAADAMARIAIQNALFLGRARASALTIPWCTYTDPEIAHVGTSEQEGNARSQAITTIQQDFDHVDRAILDGESKGLLKIYLQKGTDRILGATLVARHAGEMISELTLAITAGVGLKTLARTIHPYPTQAEAIKRAADAYNRTRLTPLVQSLLRNWLAWSR